MDKTPIKIVSFLKNDIKQGDLLKITIEEHIKVGRDGDGGIIK